MPTSRCLLTRAAAPLSLTSLKYNNLTVNGWSVETGADITGTANRQNQRFSSYWLIAANNCNLALVAVDVADGVTPSANCTVGGAMMLWVAINFVSPASGTRQQTWNPRRWRCWELVCYSPVAASSPK